MSDFLIEFGRISTQFGKTSFGSSFREQIEKALENKKVDKITLNFKGVEKVSEYFVDELYIQLFKNYSKEEIEKRIEFKETKPQVLNIFKRLAKNINSKRTTL